MQRPPARSLKNTSRTNSYPIRTTRKNLKKLKKPLVRKEEPKISNGPIKNGKSPRTMALIISFLVIGPSACTVYFFSGHHRAEIYLNSDRSCAQWLFVVPVSSSHLSAPLSPSLTFCSTVEIRCTSECLSALNCGVWPSNGWNCDINISCEDSNTIRLCCKFILKVEFWKNFQFKFIFGDLRALDLEFVFPTFSSYIYVALLFLLAPETKPKQHTMMKKYTKSRILRHFINFISFRAQM